MPSSLVLRSELTSAAIGAHLKLQGAQHDCSITGIGQGFGSKDLQPLSP